MCKNILRKTLEICVRKSMMIKIQINHASPNKPAIAFFRFGLDLHRRLCGTICLATQITCFRRSRNNNMLYANLFRHMPSRIR